MKVFIVAALLLYGAVICLAQSPSQTIGTSQQTQLQDTPYEVIDRGADYKVWQKTTYVVGPEGAPHPSIHQYRELATGLNHYVGGEWIDSSEKIEALPQGGEAATNGQHQVYFPADIDSGCIGLTTPDGILLRSRPVGLCYDDGSNTVFIALLTNSIGALASSNQVIYSSAFTGLNADVLYTDRRSGIEQDIVLREQPPAPELFGLNPLTTRLQALTEYFDTADPVQTASAVNPQDGLSDSTLKFGAMTMRHGRAFMLNTSTTANNLAVRLPVYKSWVTLQGRKFLVEEIPYRRISSQAQTLPPQTNAAFSVNSGNCVLFQVSSQRLLPPMRRVPSNSAPAKFLAKTGAPEQRGLVLDYSEVDSDESDFTFQGDTTYDITGNVYFSGTTTIEGGAVLKFPEDGSGGLDCDQVVCESTAYRPAVFTSENDNSVGETLPESSGTPAEGSSGYLEVSDSVGLNHCRFSYAGTAVTFLDASMVTDSQFLQCNYGIVGGNVEVENALASGCYIFIDALPTCENITVDNGYCAADQDGNFTNCVFSDMANIVADVYDEGAVPSGAFNGFYSSPEFGANTIVDASYPYQTAGGGSYYLADTTFRGVGTTNIDPNLLTDLAGKTTYPPIVFNDITFTATTNFSPQATRDANASLDLGYHYDPLDYAFGGCEAASNMTFTAGTAVGWFRTTSGWDHAGYGLYIANQQIAAFQGLATAPCYWVRLNTVQENDTTAGYGPGGLDGEDNQTNANIGLSPIVQADFCRFSMMAGESGNHARDDFGYLVVNANNSEFYSGSIGGYGLAFSYTNCLFDRCSVQQVQGWAGDFVNIENCTFHGTSLVLTPYSTAFPINIENCAFDGTSISVSGFGNTSTNDVYDYNAYTNSSGILPFGANNVIATNGLNWQASWFGGYYLPSDSPLIEKGDTNASRIGLYEFTTQTNQTPEGDSVVDIGYHYVATDQYGNPLETLTNNAPNYIVDANGDGLPDWWELQYFGTLNLWDTNLDAGGNSLLYDYEHGADPDVIAFSLQFTNYYLNSSPAYGTVSVSGGVPDHIAVLINDTNQADASWEPYTTSVVVPLTSGNGTYNILVGLKGFATNATQSWTGTTLIMNTSPPVITVTSPAAGTNYTSLIQIKGFANEALRSLTFDLNNAGGSLSNEDGLLIGQFYDTNILTFTSNYFQCYDVTLTNGLNTLTLHATDLEGNTSATNVSFTLSNPGVPPVVTLTWPQNGIDVAGSNFMTLGQVSDPTATVTITEVSGGMTNLYDATVGRSGTFWVESLPLNSGTNQLTVSVTDTFGNNTTTNTIATSSSVNVTVNPLTESQLQSPDITVSGTVDNSNDTITVNGISAAVTPDGGDAGGTWEADNVPVNQNGDNFIKVLATTAGGQTSGILAPAFTGPVVQVSSFHQAETENYVWGDEPSYYYPFGWYQSINAFTQNWDEGSYGNYNDYSQLIYLWDGYTNISDTTATLPQELGESYEDSGGTTNVLGFEMLYQSDDNSEGGETHINSQTALKTGGADVPGVMNLYRVKVLINDANGNAVSPSRMLVKGQPVSISEDDPNAGEILMWAPNAASAVVTPTVPGLAKFSFSQPLDLVHLAIVDTNSGTDMTLQPNTVIVGQEMNWYARLELTNGLVITNFPLSNFQWAVPGFAISNYVVAPDSSSAEVVTNFPINSTNVMFYWADGANNRIVQCSATVNGRTVVGQATFNVLKPESQIRAVTSEMTINTNWGELELSFGVPTNYGIEFLPTVSLPSGTNYNYGNTNFNLEWVQVISSNFQDSVVTDDGTLHVRSATNAFMLDGTYPYPFEPIAAPPWHNTNANDSPDAWPLESNIISSSIRLPATMWLMFQPSNGGWIPLRVVSWECQGTATNSLGSWIPAATPYWTTNPPDGDPGDSFPCWSQNVSNIVYSPPF